MQLRVSENQFPLFSRSSIGVVDHRHNLLNLCEQEPVLRPIVFQGFARCIHPRQSVYDAQAACITYALKFAEKLLAGPAQGLRSFSRKSALWDRFLLLRNQ